MTSGVLLIQVIVHGGAGAGACRWQRGWEGGGMRSGD